LELVDAPLLELHLLLELGMDRVGAQEVIMPLAAVVLVAI
jgi:hypothetical protein